ncbi:hypothetical protein G7054_g6536 [Neopestalotiopsis clavispora]|nr:hypothetical protein G7054_g6536 [Neopestalotiopsis clavispora]
MGASGKSDDGPPAEVTAPSSKSRKKPYHFYVSVFGLALVALITSWDATSLAIALPVITEQLHGTTLESFWASISFILGVALTQPVYVSVSDVLGRKPPLYCSTILFAIGAIIFALAKNMATLIAGRLVQGLGGGGLYVLQDIILADMTSLKERPLYLGLIALATAMGTILGPIVGALFTSFDWRWIGWINLPIVGISLLTFVCFLRLRAIPSTFRNKIRRLDLVGMALFWIGATATALPISWAGALYSWASWRTIVPLCVGLSVLLLFGFYERKASAEPLIPFRVLSNITASSCLVSGFMHGSILYTILLYIPLWFQAILLEAPLEAAKSTLPICCLTVAFSFIAPVVIELTRRYRILLWIGWVILTLFLGLWCLVDQNSAPAELYLFQSFLGVGVGIVFTGSQVPIQASVSHVDDTGLAVGTLIVVRLFGALIGLSISSTVFSSVFSKSIAALGQLPEPLKILEDPTLAINFIPQLRLIESADTAGIIDVYRRSFQAIWIVMTCFSGVGLVACLFIKEHSLEKEEVGRQGFVPEPDQGTTTEH